MNTDINNIEATAYYYDPAKERYFVKISFIDLGMYINSFSVQPSKFEDQPLWVQAPSHRQGKGYTPTVDFDKSYPLWRIVQEKAIEAVEQYKSDSQNTDTKDTVITDISDEPITLDDIPF